MSRLGRGRATLRGFEAGTHLTQPSEGKRPRLRIIGGSDV
jgi:hypothetical protein